MGHKIFSTCFKVKKIPKYKIWKCVGHFIMKKPYQIPSKVFEEKINEHNAVEKEDFGL